MNRTVVIPAAGLGSRLGSFTKNYSKAMCTLGRMPVISYIINKFTNQDEIIILLGYKGDLLKQVVEACHPDKNIKFVNVDIYEGPGSGLGYSLSCAYDLLQRPFLFWSCDTVLYDTDINKFPMDRNWSLVSDINDNYFNNYRHMKIDKYDEITSILPKDCDYNDNIHSYIGVSYIYDYKRFWEAYHKNKETFITVGEAYGLQNLLTLKGYIVNDWIDTGNRKIFEEYKEKLNREMTETVLEKPDEAIWFIDGRVIKFHIDTKFISDRVNRFNSMLCKNQKKNGISLPELISYSDNVYVYRRAPGEIASNQITSSMLNDILTKYFDIEETHISDSEKINIYEDFYKNKTLSRISKYCNEYEDIDNECYINGVKCQSASELIKSVNWEKLALNGVFTNNYHGDFHLENILVNNDNYIMLDWRQNFGKTMVGDIYYDIAKMWHSLIVNHNMVRANNFSVTNITRDNIKIDIHRTFIDTECEKTLIQYINNSKYNIKQAEFLTAVIFLNIAACHIYPYSKFLFNLGKYMINIFYNNNKDFWK